jgi:hypothetical protein
LTWKYTQALSLRTNWDEQNGFFVKRSDDYAKDLVQDMGSKNDLKASYNAMIPDHSIKVNNKLIDNSKEEYPLLVFRDVTYFPLTWRFAVTEFGLETRWDYKRGLGFGKVDKIKLPAAGKIATTGKLKGTITWQSE